MNGRLVGPALAGALVVSLGALTPVAASAADEDSGVFVYAQGGGYSPVQDLNDPGTAQFKTGFVAGGGLGYRFNRYVALRGNFNFARTEADARTFVIDGTKFNRFLYDADVQLRYPSDGGLAPYLFAGGGAVTVKQDIDNAPDSFTKGAGKFGVGLSYDFPKSGASVFAEGTGWVYKWDRFGFDKTQVDIAWTAGVAYRFGR